VAPLNKIVYARSEPGVIIFNLKKQITFADQVALEIFNSERSNGHGNHPLSNFKLPGGLSRIHAELKARLGRYTWNSCRDAVYLKKIITIRDRHFLIRAFIISAPRNPTSTHFLVLIDRLFDRSKIELDPARVHYHLSSKEFEVVQLLIGGRTNKEIANELNIAECTVKEYLGKVMSKVGVSTWAGVVAQVLSSSGRDLRNGGRNRAFVNKSPEPESHPPATWVKSPENERDLVGNMNAALNQSK